MREDKVMRRKELQREIRGGQQRRSTEVHGGPRRSTKIHGDQRRPDEINDSPRQWSIFCKVQWMISRQLKALRKRRNPKKGISLTSCFVVCLFLFNVLFCFVLFCFVLFCFVLFCFILFYFVLFCFPFLYFILSLFVYLYIFQVFHWQAYDVSQQAQYIHHVTHSTSNLSMTSLHLSLPAPKKETAKDEVQKMMRRQEGEET